jgi:hypothetical protein
LFLEAAMSDVVFARASAAYEKARRKSALTTLPCGLPLFLLATWAGGDVGGAALMAVLLAAVVAVAHFRSRAAFVGAVGGVVVSCIPLAMGSVLQKSCVCAGGICFSMCGVGCASGATVVGAWLGWRVARERAFLDGLGAATCASVIGMLLCPITGVGSVVGAAAGAVFGMTPLFAHGMWRTRRHNALDDAAHHP